VANSNRTSPPIQAEVIPEVFFFGPFRVAPNARLLERDGNPTSLGSRAFDLLCLLISRPGDVVSKGDLMARAWPGLTVDESSLRFHITQLRRVLGNGKDGESYVANVPGRGYCFVAPTSRERVESIVPAADTSFNALYQLPPPLTRMVGREETVREICQKLIAERFVSIVGPGGMGKTTVALAVAHALLMEFRGAVCFVELGPLSAPQLLAGTVASAFGLPVQSQDPIPGLVAHLRGKRILLILDSTQHALLNISKFHGWPAYVLRASGLALQNLSIIRCNLHWQVRKFVPGVFHTTA